MSESDGVSGFTPPTIDDLNQWLPTYDFIDLIACGGMGAVYRARHISLDRMVAIKILPPELSINDDFRRSFEAEGKAMAKLTHSNLVGVYDFGEISDMLFLAIEFVDGSNLFKSKGDSAIDPETAVTLIHSVAKGLGAANRIGIVHRDIKPANILINTELVPKLGDFGLAVPDSDIESGLMMGTPAYLAPEVMDDPTSASFASDTYALGVILYELLTGDSIEGGDVLNLSRIPVVGTLPKIVRKALAPKPLLRYQDGNTLADALEDWLSKPKSPGLTMNSAGPRVQASVAPIISDESEGGNAPFFALAALVIVSAVAYIVFKPGSITPDSAEKYSPNSIIVEPDGPRSDEEVAKTGTGKSIEELRSSQKTSFQELSTKISAEYSQNRRDFLEGSGEEGKEFLSAIQNDSVTLPRYLNEDETLISEDLLPYLQKFAISRQTKIAQGFRSKISSLHRNALDDLRATDETVPEDIYSSWENWSEWLGLSPLEAMHQPLEGHWRLTQDNNEVDFHVTATGKLMLIEGHDQHPVSLNYEPRGVIQLNSSANSTLYFPWILRWRGDYLEGTDVQGEQRILKLVDFDYSTLVKTAGASETQDTRMVEALPEKEKAPEFEPFDDPEVEALTENYRRALTKKIGPLEAGYLRVLNGFLSSYQDQKNETVVEQIENELIWIKDLNWREGFTHLSLIQPSGELPSKLSQQRSVFLKEFERRYQPIQRTYLSSLKQMQTYRISKGRNEVEEIRKAIKKIEKPEIQVAKATFGVGKELVDVTEKIQDYASDPRKTVKISSSGMSVKNPSGYNRLCLSISYLLNGHQHYINIPRGDTMNLYELLRKKDTPNRYQKLKLKVVKASFGGGKNFADVTERVKELLLKGTGSFKANPAFLKKDPTPGWRKKLIITFEMNGTSISKEWKEDRTVYFTEFSL